MRSQSPFSSAQTREEPKGDKGYSLEIFYTNVEGEAINRIYRALDEGVHGLVMNPVAGGNPVSTR